MDFPVIDLAPLRGGSDAELSALAGAVDDACRDIGFFSVANHAVPAPAIDAAWRAAREFFDRPLAEKLELVSADPAYPYGYEPLQQESLGASGGREARPDLKETFNLAPPVRPEVAAVGGYQLSERVWPSNPVGFRAAWSDYYAEMEALAGRLMRVFALALDLEPEFFDSKIDRHLSALRALNYPAQSTPPEPGQLRAGEHTDYGTLTILLPGRATGGLEVLSYGGEWLRVPDLAGSFVVNIGDLMAMWTNDRWLSTLHRVVNPSATVAATERRQSIAFFHQPNWDAEIECLPTCRSATDPPRYPTTRSGEWLSRKVAAAHGGA